MIFYRHQIEEGKQMKLKNLIFFICGVFLLSDGSYGYVAEENLLDELMKNYNYQIRPTIPPTIIKIHLILAQLISVSEREQYMTSKIWLVQEWNDDRLSWKPEYFDNIEQVQIPVEQIWRPDIILFNNADGNFDVSMKPNAVVKFDGSVIWRPPAVYKSLCKMEVVFFPFDSQQCHMKFTSWTYDRNDVRMILSQENATKGRNFDESGEWDILGIPAKWMKDNKNTNIEYLNYSVKIRRKPLFYIIYLIIPSLFITFLAICVFVLPSDSGEKMTLVISCLLSLTVFILLIFKMIPPTSLNIPLISKYLMFMMVLVTLSTLASVVVLNIHHRTPNTHQIPHKFRVLFLENLPRFLRMERPESDENETNNSHFNLKVDDLSGSSFLRHRLMTSQSDIPAEVISATYRLNYVVDYLKYQDRYKQVQDDWKFAAMVTDRLLFYVFTIALIIGTTVVIM